jgi:hypothetical protein
MIWSQSLYLRDPQLKDVPDSLATELKIHLQALAVRSTTEAYSRAQESALTPQDVLHRHSSRAYALIQQIRLLPGLERFMLGESFETLCTTAAGHPIVVLVGARGRYHALIIAPSQPYCRFPTKCARGWSMTQVCGCDGVRGEAALPKLRDMGVRGGENVISS